MSFVTASGSASHASSSPPRTAASRPDHHASGWRCPSVGALQTVDTLGKGGQILDHELDSLDFQGRPVTLAQGRVVLGRTLD